MPFVVSYDLSVADDFNIDIVDADPARGGWQLLISSDGDEISVVMSEQQIQKLSDKLGEFGYLASNSEAIASESYRGDIDRLRSALSTIGERIKKFPSYAELNEEQEQYYGGDTAELSYLARIADSALSRGNKGGPGSAAY